MTNVLAVPVVRSALLALLLPRTLVPGVVLVATLFLLAALGLLGRRGKQGLLIPAVPLGSMTLLTLLPSLAFLVLLWLSWPVVLGLLGLLTARPLLVRLILVVLLCWLACLPLCLGLRARGPPAPSVVRWWGFCCRGSPGQSAGVVPWAKPLRRLAQGRRLGCFGTLLTW